MTAITTANVTYAFLAKKVEGGSGKKCHTVSVTFGNATLTVPAGGVPLLAGLLGMPNTVTEATILDQSNADGYTYKLDLVNLKIRIYQPGASASIPQAELTTAYAPASTTLKLMVWGY